MKKHDEAASSTRTLGTEDEEVASASEDSMTTQRTRLWRARLEQQRGPNRAVKRIKRALRNQGWTEEEIAPLTAQEVLAMLQRSIL